MKSNTTTILIAVGALLFGGVATAAYMNSRGTPADAVAAAPVETASLQASATDTALDDAAPVVPSGPTGWIDGWMVCCLPTQIAFCRWMRLPRAWQGKYRTQRLRRAATPVLLT